MKKQVLVLVLVLLFWAVAGFAITINVPDNYSTIQGGLNAASEDDTVLVSNGIYFENIVWPMVNGIKLIGSSQDSCIIDGDEQGSVVTFNDSDNLIDSTTVIKNFTLQNGNAFGGGGVYCNDSHPNIINVTITNNIANNGGGIYGNNNSVIKFSNVNVINNSANYGGGIANCNIVENCLVKYNSANNSGGGINNCYLIKNCKITNNVAYPSDSYEGGGGVANCDRIENSIIANNNINQSHIYTGGGGVYNCQYIVNCTIYNNLVQGNSDVTTSGGGIWIDRIEVTIINSIIYGNKVGSNENQIFILHFLSYAELPFNFFNNNIQGGEEEITYVGGYGEIGCYRNCIDSDPLLINPTNGSGASYSTNNSDWHLQVSSPCVDSGADWYYYDEDGTIADIGALTTNNLAGTGELSPDTFAGGEITGTLNEDILFVGDITIPENDSLIISSGVTFQGFNAKINVNGKLKAYGTNGSRITFTGINGGFWDGIYGGYIDLKYCDLGNSQNYVINSNNIYLSYCDITSSIDGSGSITYCNLQNLLPINYSSLDFSGDFKNNYFSNYGLDGEIEFHYNTNIVNNIIENVAFMHIEDNTALIENHIYNVDLDIMSFDNALIQYNCFDDCNIFAENIDFRNNIVLNNNTGMDLWGSSSIVSNNVFYNLNDAFEYDGDEELNITNNIIWNCNSVNSNWGSGNITADYCCIEGSYAGTGNIDQNPQFVDPSNSDFNLLVTSPCLNAGDPTSPLDPDGTRADMGAFYYHHTQDFAATPRFGNTVLMVNFNDQSEGTVIGWEWDFDSDGTFDSFEQNPIYNYSQSGMYDVTFVIERSPTLKDTLIKENYIVVQDSNLQPPQNPTIAINSNNIVLNWDAVIEADYYLIYISDNPYNDFEYLDYTTAVTSYTHSDVISQENKQFYIIIGFDGTMERLAEFIEKNPTKSFKTEFLNK